MIIQEAMVYKKPKNLLTIEKNIKKIKEKYDDQFTYVYDSDIKDFNVLIKDYTTKQFTNDYKKYLIPVLNALIDEFNFSKESNIFIRYSPYYNMTTSYYVIDTSNVDISNIDDIVKMSKDGRVKFANKNIMTTEIFIYTGMVFDSKFTAEEITATLLHEVGHAFAYPFIKLAYSLSALDMMADIDSIKDARRKYEAQNNFKKFIINSYGNFRLKASLMNFTNDEQEKFADHFSSHYGYADSLSYALLNMGDISHTMDRRDHLDEITKTLDDINTIVIRMITKNHRYPEVYERIIYTTKELRTEIENNQRLSPKDKKKLKAKLDKIQAKFYKFYGNKTADSAITKYMSNKRLNDFKTGLDLDNQIHNTFDRYSDML